jgi:hypothetical protein
MIAQWPFMIGCAAKFHPKGDILAPSSSERVTATPSVSSEPVKPGEAGSAGEHLKLKDIFDRLISCLN